MGRLASKNQVVQSLAFDGQRACDNLRNLGCVYNNIRICNDSWYYRYIDPYHLACSRLQRFAIGAMGFPASRHK
jgi:hypothetical protein